MSLKELRKSKKLTQKQCAEYLEIPLRTYVNYENNPEKEGTLKYRYMMEKLSGFGIIDEENGILSLDSISDICARVFDDYPVKFCYLFGSYAKGKATGKSDVDLLVSTDIGGLGFFEMTEALRQKLNKKVDVLHIDQLKNNFELLQEILKDGVKIYG
ncbi:MAG: nucleotidyltransferase domain-containing protein [Oscillospiraceae bacterium]|nr:nucleotidyltransferase domain-containing protein [Oscillospiraceae bacterium]